MGLGQQAVKLVDHAIPIIQHIDGDHRRYDNERQHIEHRQACQQNVSGKASDTATHSLNARIHRIGIIAQMALPAIQPSSLWV